MTSCRGCVTAACTGMNSNVCEHWCLRAQGGKQRRNACVHLNCACALQQAAPHWHNVELEC
eukprot:6213627-Pleurochrysis_carterae.AAC.2